MIKTRNFSLATDPLLACSCGCNQCNVQQHALNKLQDMRDICGFPLVVTSGYRCPNHYAEIAKPKPGQHASGLAFDIKIDNSVQRYKVIESAIACKARGIGVSKTFIHVDWRGLSKDGILQEDAMPQLAWTY